MKKAEQLIEQYLSESYPSAAKITVLAKKFGGTIVSQMSDRVSFKFPTPNDAGKFQYASSQLGVPSYPPPMQHSSKVVVTLEGIRETVDPHSSNFLNSVNSIAQKYGGRRDPGAASFMNAWKFKSAADLDKFMNDPEIKGSKFYSSKSSLLAAIDK